MARTLRDIHADALRGQSGAENELFQYLAVRFHHFAHHRVWNRDDAEEVIQEALSVIAREYRSLDVTVSFQAWAYKVLDNRILAYIKRRQQRQEAVTDQLDDVVAVTDPGPLYRQLRSCLGELLKVNRRYARILNFGYQGYSMDEICARLDLTRNNAYVILSRARAALELCLKTGRM